MIRQHSTRNQRSKGRRMKNVLKICAMVVVCFWLLYQLRHSYNKKRAADDSSSKMLMASSGPNLLKLARKDLPQSEEIHSRQGTNNEDENSEGEEEEDQEVKEAIEDLDRRGTEDDEINVQDHERDDDQDDRDGDLDESENGDEVANEEDKKDHDDNVEELEFLDDHDHEDRSRDAHEGNYKKDDSSSVALQGGQETETKDENGSMHNKLKEIIETVVDKNDVPKVKDDSYKINNVSIVKGPQPGNETILSNDQTIVNGATKKQASEVPDNQLVSQINSTRSSWSENQNLQADHVSVQHGILSSSSAEDQKTISNLGSPKEIKLAPGNWTREKAEMANRTLQAAEFGKTLNENNVKVL